MDVITICVVSLLITLILCAAGYFAETHKLLTLLPTTLNPEFKKIECPIAMKMEIDEAELVELKNSNSGVLSSSWFEASNIPGVKYALGIFPNGQSEDKRGQTWITLAICTGKEAKVHADVRLSIEAAGWNYRLVQVYQNALGGGSTCCATKHLFYPQYIVDGILTIKCEGILSVERTSDSVDASDVDEKWRNEGFLGNIWSGNNTDFNITVGEESLRVSFPTVFFQIFSA